MPIPMTHLSVQVIRPVCPRSELSLLCVCPFTAVNALLYNITHYCNKHASSNTTTVILSQALYIATGGVWLV